MINRRNLIVLTGMLSILLAACSNKPSYSDGNQVTPTVTVAATPDDTPGNNEPTGTEEFGKYRVPEGDGDVETPKGSGDFFDITTYDCRNQEKTIFKVTIYSETSPEEEERIWNEIKSLEGVKITQKAYFSGDFEIEALVSDLSPEYVEYKQAEYAGFGTGVEQRTQIEIRSYEGCEDTILYQVPNYISGNESDLIRYSGDSILNYKALDEVKLIGYYWDILDSGEMPVSEVNWLLEIDEYHSGDIWWMNSYRCVDTPQLLVPYEVFEKMVKGTCNEPKKAEYYVKCADGYGEQLNQEMTEILGNYGRVEPLAGFVDCDWTVVE